MKYIIINNWSERNQEELIAQSASDLGGVAVPRLSLSGDMAILKMNEENIPDNATGYDRVEIREVLDTLDWTETPSEDNEIEI